MEENLRFCEIICKGKMFLMNWCSIRRRIKIFIWRSGSSQHASKTPSASSSRSASPSASSIHSFIPQPTTGKPAPSNKHTQEKQQYRPVAQSNKSNVTSRHLNSASTTTSNTNLGKNSMLDKFKFFNSKDKSERSKAVSVSKRTSSSSGFSSARSEKSDSSTSLCSEPKLPVTTISSDVPDNISSLGGVKNLARKTFGKSTNNNEQKPAVKPVIQKSVGKTLIVKDSAKSRGDEKPSRSEASAKSDDVVQIEDLDDECGVRNRHQQSDNGKDYTGALDLENHIKQSKISLIPKGDKVKAGKFAEGKDGGSTAVVSPTSTMNPGFASNACSIPKPTAAIKGTTKISKDEKSILTNTVTAQVKTVRTNPIATAKVHATPSTNISKHSVKPLKSDASTLTDPPKPVSLSQSSFPRNAKSDRKRSDNNPTNVSIAMVSPMQSIGKEVSQEQIIQHRSSPKLSTHSKVETTFDNTDKVITRETSLSNPAQETTFSEEADDIMVNIKPMQPMMRASPYSYTRNLGVYSLSRSVAPSLHVSHLGLHNERGQRITAHHDHSGIYASSMKCVANPTMLDADYACNVDHVSMSNGYMSDGDMLRSGRSDDIGSGYMSEGGASLYARRVQARLREGLAAVKECMQKSTSYISSDNYDDSSSVSSGISDTIAEMSTDENLTTSSVSSEHTNPYASLKRMPKELLNRAQYYTGNDNGDRSKRTQEVVNCGRSSGGSSKSSAFKSSTGQQTESSAFRQVSSSATGWKKYPSDRDPMRTIVEAPTRYPQDRMDLLRRGKSDLDPTKTRDKRGSNGTSSGMLRKSTTIMGAALTTGLQDKSGNNNSPKSKRRSSSSQGKHRTSSENLNKDKTSPRTSRSGSLEPQSSSNDRRVQNVRAMNNISTSNGKRPTSTGSASSSGSNRSGGSKVSGKRSSSDKLSDAGKEALLDTASPYEAMRNYIGLSAIPRPSSVPPKMENCRGSLEHKTRSKINPHAMTEYPHSDCDYGRNSLGRKPKQYYVTSPTHGMRDRVFGSRGALNNSPTPEYSILSHASRESCGNSNYAWLRQSPSVVSSLSGVQNPRICGSLTEAESMESLASLSSVHSQLQHARANSLTPARLLLHQREINASTGPRLARSNSIRSTKSEKLYPSMMQRSGDIDNFLSGPLSVSTHSSPHKELRHHHHTSQPTSPTLTHQTNSSYGYAISTASSSAPAATMISPYMGSLLSKINVKDGDLHGSSLSLGSTNSSIYSTVDDKNNHEIHKLRRELIEAHDKVQNLTSQLSGNAHVVAAFEQSLSNMTCRLQTLTANAEQKDCELDELRSTIDSLRKRSVDAGLNPANFQSTPHLTPHLVRRHTFNSSKDSASLQEHRISRQLSTDSMSSINSASSACSVASQTSGNSQKSTDAFNLKKKKKKGWLRSSFSKAFSRSKKNKNGSVSDVEDLRQLQSVPNSPLLNSSHAANGQGMKVSHSSSAIYDKNEEDAPEVQELQKQLREKDMVLTDIRLEALSSAHQLESLKETVTKMKSEMNNLKHDNERLQKLVSTKSLTSSQSSLQITDSLDHRLSASEMSAPSSVDMLLADATDKTTGKKVSISVLLGCHGIYEKYIKSVEGQQVAEIIIGGIYISGKTKWDLLDSAVRRTFKEYVLRVDPVSNLGLNAESVISYHIGEVARSKDSDIPDLLPCGYIIGDEANIRVVLKGTKQNSVDALAFETLIPKSIIQRYISLLSEHRRIILCGPSGTGKTYLAERLSEFLVLRSGKDLTPGVIATFSVDHKSAKELRQYLSNVAEQCESSNPSELPSVIILDNLHHVGSLGEVFNGFLNAKYQNPYIIGTMNQTTCSTTNLQLHHNFRWILCANHMEPVKGFLGRYLRRKLIEHEVKTGESNNDLTKVVDWMSKVWQHLNKFLETHSSSDVTIGPRLFLSCPNDISSSQVWFTDLWNYSVVPYLLDAIREGLQLYGRRAPWEDPAAWVLESYPWPPGSPPSDWPSLLRLRPEDVGYDGNLGPSSGNPKSAHGTGNETDPLLSMLMRLQEAASYSSPQSNDSDSVSVDSSSLQTDETCSGVESTMYR
uniref:AAA+ ATPase domain-containing protein n=1 Tax=Strigamia maritima TaxID=126957 RepID=T1JCI4_STRMM